MTHFYLWKKSAKGCITLVWIAGCWNSSKILLTSHRNPKAFLEHGSAEKIAFCAHTIRDPNKQEVGLIFI
jgi:hypothetical protein